MSQNEILEVVRQFVLLIQSCPNLNTCMDIAHAKDPAQHEKLFALLRAAGFEDETFKLSTGPETAPFMVWFGKQCVLNKRATDWLNEIFMEIFVGLHLQRRKEAELINVVVNRIERRHPLPPITLNTRGDQLREPTTLGGSRGEDRHVHDEDPLLYGDIGIHEDCGGTFSRNWCTPAPGQRIMDETIRCSKCGVAVVISNEIRTYGHLRRYCEATLTPQL